MSIQLHDYQLGAKDFIKTHPFCALFLSMGMGKTLTTLAALEEINPPGHILIIAPKTIARSTWIDEIKKWGFNVNCESLIVNERGKPLSKKKRLEKYASIPHTSPSIWFINRELICDLIENTPDWYFPTVVIDEMQGFKSNKSARFKALKKVRPKMKRLIGLSGTPTPNGLMDLWAEIYLLDMGYRLGATMTRYRETFFRPTRYMNGFAIDWAELPGAKDEIYRRISDVVMSAENTNIQLPALTINDMHGYMSADEQKLYDSLKKDSVLSCIDGDLDTATVDTDPEDMLAAVNAAVLQGKLMQLASGSLYTDENHNYTVVHDIKIEQCKYIVDNTPSPVLIAYHFQSDAERLLAAIPDAKLFDKTPEMIHDWNSGKIPIMLIQPSSAGHGLNLQDGGHTLVWFTVPWSLEEYLQTNARLYRQGQTQPVVIHRLLMHGTIDERIVRVVEMKDANEKELLDAVKQEFIDIFDDIFDEQNSERQCYLDSVRIIT